MIPLRDDQPSFSTPFINYFLIGLNLLVYLWEISVQVQSPRALNAFVMQFGLVPRHVIAVLSAHSQASPVTAIMPFFTSMFSARIFHACCGKYAVSLDFRRQHRRLPRPLQVRDVLSGQRIAAAVTQILLNPNRGCRRWALAERLPGSWELISFCILALAY